MLRRIITIVAGVLLVLVLVAALLWISASGEAGALASCPVTRPERPFSPPGLAEGAKASGDDYFWFGSEALWTQLPKDGVWAGLPRDEEGYIQKLFFSRAGYNWREEPQPALAVSGRRLDEEGLGFSLADATNGFHPDVGSFMLLGVAIPTAGCWQITAEYQGQTVAYVVWIEGE